MREIRLSGLTRGRVMPSLLYGKLSNKCQVRRKTAEEVFQLASEIEEGINN
jgi:hypothetical protein